LLVGRQMKNIKQVIVIRRDLRMRRGKEIAQGSHASIAFLTNRMSPCDDYDGSSSGGHIAYLTENEIEWIATGNTKVCVRVDSEQELDDIYNAAKAAGLEVHMIIDEGATEFHGNKTKTCLAIGPNAAGEIDRITGHLQLY